MPKIIAKDARHCSRSFFAKPWELTEKYYSIPGKICLWFLNICVINIQCNKESQGKKKLFILITITTLNIIMSFFLLFDSRFPLSDADTLAVKKRSRSSATCNRTRGVTRRTNRTSATRATSVLATNPRCSNTYQSTRRANTSRRTFVSIAAKAILRRRTCRSTCRNTPSGRIRGHRLDLD